MRYIFLPLWVFTVACASFGQIIIHGSDFSAIGTSLTFASASNVTFDVGQSGANQNWTFGNYNFAVHLQKDYINPLDGPHGSQFPAATRAVRNHASNYPGQTWYDYLRIDSSGSYYLGMEDAQGNVYENYGQRLQEPLPLEFGASWSIVMIDTLVNIPNQLSILIDTTLHVIDGWGSVHTPYGDYPCLRTFAEQRSHIFDNGVLTSTYYYFNYSWLNQSGNGIISIDKYSDEWNPNFSTGDITMIDVPLAIRESATQVVREFTVSQNYPNPFNPVTVVPITLMRRDMVKVSVYNTLGHLVYHNCSSMDAGSSSILINGQTWATGNYFVNISTAGQRQTIRMELIK